MTVPIDALLAARAEAVRHGIPALDDRIIWAAAPHIAAAVAEQIAVELERIAQYVNARDRYFDQADGAAVAETYEAAAEVARRMGADNG